MRFRFKVWKDWYRHCTNGRIYKILVLVGLAHSPTFNQLYSFEKYKNSIAGAFYYGFLGGVESNNESDRN